MTARDMAHGWQLTGSSADAYDELLVPAIFEPCARGLVDVADLHPGDRVLDVYVDDDGLAPVESHVALALAGARR